MNSTLFEKQNEYAKSISAFRRAGNLGAAIKICDRAISEFPEDNFFYKIKGDIYFQQKDYSGASECYLENLERLNGRRNLFRTFVRFYKHLENEASHEFMIEYQKVIRQKIQSNVFSPETTSLLVEFFGVEIILDNSVIGILPLLDDDYNLGKVSQKVRQWRKNGRQDCLNAIVQYKIKQSTANSKSVKIDQFLIQTLVAESEYRNAIMLIEKTQKPLDNKTIIALTLRACRMLKDYSAAQRLLKINNEFIDNADFNVQYELVYFFDEIKDEQRLARTLKNMRSAAEASMPIARTLYNFNLSFGRMEEAKEVYVHIQKLLESSKPRNESNNDRQENEQESEQVVWQRIKELSDEQEHTRQMIALKDLLKGFSHELGQPITNIRYDVQLHQMKMRSGLVTDDDWCTLLERILKQTERIGSLLQRFRPMVSSRGEQRTFNVFSCITEVFFDLDSRLREAGIKYTVSGTKQAILFGDSVQLSQVFYNLALNSIQAISSVTTRKNENLILVNIAEVNNELIIAFSDNGPGIPTENYRKIFEPFFSTKDPTSGNGGEGLGLFIVWNVLRMFNGSIKVDSSYKNGAKFIMRFKLKGETQA